MFLQGFEEKSILPARGFIETLQNIHKPVPNMENVFHLFKKIYKNKLTNSKRMHKSSPRFDLIFPDILETLQLLLHKIVLATNK
jgi:hypothetical protein